MMNETKKLSSSRVAESKTTWTIASSDPMVILHDGCVVRMSQALAWDERYVLSPSQIG